MTTSAASVDMFELPRSTIGTAKKRAALTRTTRAPGKLTVQRFTGAPSLASATWPAAVFCSTSIVLVAACFLIFCLVPASFTAAHFFAFFSALFSSPLASVFAALIVNSFAASSDCLVGLVEKGLKDDERAHIVACVDFAVLYEGGVGLQRRRSAAT